MSLILLSAGPLLAFAQTETFDNPLAFTDFSDLLAAVLNVFIIILVPIIVLFIIYAGFQYVTAKGNPEQLKKANQALLYAVIGGVIIIGAVAILSIIEAVVAEF
jgi:amino acid transporter